MRTFLPEIEIEERCLQGDFTQLGLSHGYDYGRILTLVPCHSLSREPVIDGLAGLVWAFLGTTGMYQMLGRARSPYN